ncbi:sulfatase-like hydrolase/transferase [Algibacillus agarilyticus]|uniref:sulfatase-like hydrolase/transferase n=1 Tax=Algibacillus agarilyticus TaxID=2234133 RepID=UPI001E5A1CD8|nr:sulfatase-like hydrolase/transferase [Algibacillus agarilyticus]
MMKLNNYLKQKWIGQHRPLWLASALSCFLVACNDKQPTNEEANTKPAVANVVTDAKKQTQPNILFILADDHRWDLIGKYHPIIKTPNLDALADRGTVFKNAFVTTPICASSRVSILTGLTERTHDFTFQQPSTGIQESANAYPRLLKQDGYRSAFVGKYEIKISGEPTDRFDYYKPLLQAKTETYEGQELPQTYYIAELANDFIEQSKTSGQPWAMSVNFWNPHAHDRDQEMQYHYPEEFESWYQDVDVPPAKFSDDASFNALPEFLKGSIARDRWQYRYSTPELYQKMTKRHYRAISSVDRAVGMIYKSLEANGMADNTIIIYTGDNGYALNERQLAGKWFGWEEDLRVPLIIYDPRNKNSHGKEVEQTALNIDFAPTMLTLAGLTPPETYQGQSLLPLMSAEPVANWREEFFFEHMYQPKRALIPPMVGVRTPEWKYVEFYKHGHRQLYNLIDDPQEAHNLINSTKHQARAKEMRAKVSNYIKKYEDQRTEEVKNRPDFKNTWLPTGGVK